MAITATGTTTGIAASPPSAAAASDTNGTWERELDCKHTLNSSQRSRLRRFAALSSRRQGESPTNSCRLRGSFSGDRIAHPPQGEGMREFAALSIAMRRCVSRGLHPTLSDVRFRRRAAGGRPKAAAARAVASRAGDSVGAAWADSAGDGKLLCSGGDVLWTILSVGPLGGGAKGPNEVAPVGVTHACARTAGAAAVERGDDCMLRACACWSVFRCVLSLLNVRWKRSSCPLGAGGSAVGATSKPKRAMGAVGDTGDSVALVGEHLGPCAGVRAGAGDALWEGGNAPIAGLKEQTKGTPIPRMGEEDE